MRLSKYFALVLVLFAGQSMAGPFNGYPGYHSDYNDNVWLIRSGAQHLINAERNLLVAIKYYGAANSRAASDVRKLVYKTIRLRNAIAHTRNRNVLRAQLRHIRNQFAHVQRSIARNHRLNHAHQIQNKVRNVAHKLNKLSHDVYRFRSHVYY